MMTYSLKKTLFPLGRILIAPEIETLGINTPRLLRRHQTGDFGDISEYDVQQNHQAVECGDEILSQYRVIIENMWILICVMTEADRSRTVVFVLHKKNSNLRNSRRTVTIKSPKVPDFLVS